MKKLELELNGNYYLPKEAFNHSDLSIAEVRLLIVLSSKQGITLSDLSHNNKMWVCGSEKNYSKLQSMVDNLITKRLIDTNGCGLTLVGSDKGYSKFTNIETIEKCKNLRQLFVSCLPTWHTGGLILLSIDMFKDLFGDSKMFINKNWKRVMEQTGYSYTWKEVNNQIVIESYNKLINDVAEVKFTLPKVKTNIETVIEEPIIDKDCSVLSELEDLVREIEEEAIPKPIRTYTYEGDL